MVDVKCICIKIFPATAGLGRLWHTPPMDSQDPKNKAKSEQTKANNDSAAEDKPPKEIGGRGGLDPTRYGDWEKSGRCIDF